MPCLSGPAALAARASLFAALAGCAAAPSGWQRADTSAETADEALADCRAKASPAIVVVTPPAGPQSQTYEGAVMRGMYEVETCMRLKGYIRPRARP